MVVKEDPALEAETSETQRNDRNLQNNTSYNIDTFSSGPQKVDLRVTKEKTGSEKIQLDQLIQDHSGFIQTIKRELRVSLDQKTGHTIVAVIDGDKQDIVRQLPQDKTLEVERMITAPSGMLFRAFA